MLSLTHAIILAAGLGTRMRPLTEKIPKPLIEINNKPLIDWCLEWLEASTVAHVVINTSYRAQQLEDYLRPRTSPHIQISREEPAPLETGGGIVKALPMLGHGPFLAMNSDAIFLPSPVHPVERLKSLWDDSLDFLMLLIPRENAIGWQGRGDFVLSEDGRIRRPHHHEDAHYIFSGVEIIHPRVFEGAPGGAFSLSRLWHDRADEDGWLKNVCALVHEGKWLNVGDLGGLEIAQHHLQKRAACL